MVMINMMVITYRPLVGLEAPSGVQTVCSSKDNKYNDKDKYKDKCKDKYKDKDKVKVQKILNMCYIFEKQRVQGYQI